MQLHVIIVGGGVGGLTLANHLRRYNHEVTLIESKSVYTPLNTGGGLNLTRNATLCLDLISPSRSEGATSDSDLDPSWKSIADEHDQTFIRRHSDGTIIKKADGRWHAMVHRTDLLLWLHNLTQLNGTKCMYGKIVNGIAEDELGAKVTLADGEVVRGDLVVGADGINSAVRRVIYKDEYRPFLTGDRTFLLDVPKSVMMQHASCADVYSHDKKPYSFWLGPERNIISWTMSRREVYHLQMNQHNVHVDGPDKNDSREEKRYAQPYEDIDSLRELFSDFAEPVKRLLQATNRCLEWRIAELPDLPSWSSDRGKIVLIGDACHAFPPFAGQGACMAIEDAACLALLLSKPEVESVQQAVKAYEEIRRPRVDGMRDIVHENTRIWSKPDTENHHNGKPKWASMDRWQWMYEYDPLSETRRYGATAPPGPRLA